MIESFWLENFRSYSSRQDIYFSQPNSDKIWSWITYIVWDNNSWKTTIIEWIINISKSKTPINDSERIPKKEPSFFLKTSDSLDEQKFTSISSWSPFLNTIWLDCFELVPSRRYWWSASSWNHDSEYILKRSIDGTPRWSWSSFQTATLLKDIHEDEDKKKRFDNLIKRILPDFCNWRIGYEGGEFVSYQTTDWVKHKTDFLWDWVISIFRILSHFIHESSNWRLLIIDEPELSLSPRMLKRLLRVIWEISKERQILLSTHSPYLIDNDFLRNWAILNKISKYGDHESKIYSIKNFDKYIVLDTNFKSPYKFDIVAKELFFQDDVLFLEWVEDTGLLMKYFANTDINLFWYWVRWFSQFEGFLKLSNDLWIQKAAVIFDNGDNETIKFNELNSYYWEKYKILKWNKEDIRDKDMCNWCSDKNCKICKLHRKDKNWYFDVNWWIKVSSQLDDFHLKINEIKEYFSS